MRASSLSALNQPKLEDWLQSTLGVAGLDLLRRHTMYPRATSGLIQIAHEDGVVGGCAMAMHTRRRLGAAVLECGALTLVVPEQHEELTELLLSACLPAIADLGAGLVLMHGSAQELGQFGLAPYCYKTVTTLPMHHRPAGQAGLRQATPDDCDDLAALYDATYAYIPRTEVRTHADWRAWPYDQCLALEDTRRRVVAYIRRMQGGIVEAAAADSGVARELLLELGSEQSHLNLPDAHPVVHAALQLSGSRTTQAYRVDQEAPLAGVLDLSEALTQLVPELTVRLARSRYAGWEGVLRLEAEGDWAGIAFEGSSAGVVARSVAADLRIRRASLAGLAQLLLGYRSASDLRATGDLDFDDTALGLVEAVFPLV